VNRRQFIQTSLVGAGIAAMAASCKSPKKIKGSIIGASAHIGHRLRDGNISTGNSTPSQYNIVIVGGGVAGLSAARWLTRQGVKDIVLLDIEKQMGGNAASGSNAVSAYPWGAHYIPLPNNNLPEYLSFLEEHEVITGWDANGLPVYNEYYLCFDPEERLYINGRWQEGLVPQYGLPANDQQQVHAFLARMDAFRHAKDASGKDAFSIPVNYSSTAAEWTVLDTVTMKQWMTDNGYHSPYLHWYVNYCTKDDFGTPYDQVSAWVGIHYFAGRKGKGSNAAYQDVLTWPEGNGFLVKKLQQSAEVLHKNECLVTKVTSTNTGVSITYFDAAGNSLHNIEANQCILCVPQFIAARLLADDARLQQVHRHYQYSPWMVANLLVNELSERSGAPASWDNVMYGSDSLGYVDATHQLVQQSKRQRNLTYYLPLTNNDPATERKNASQRSHADWVEMIFRDLEKVHPNIREATDEVNVMTWGHAMMQPRPGTIHGTIRHELGKSIGKHIHFAHTDLAGISIFEEAFYQGIAAAKKVIESLPV